MNTHLMSKKLLAPLSAGLLLTAVASPSRAETPEQKGLQIALMIDKENEGFVSEKSEMTMELINAHGETTTRKMVNETMEGKEDGDKSRVEFKWPADVKGTKLLTWTHKKADDEQWLFLPAVKRIKRISSNNKSGSFMGSEFAYEDIGGQEIEKYSYKYLDEPAEDGRATWRLERYPADKNSGYKRQIVWFDKEYKQVLRIDYFDRKDTLLKVARFSDYKKHGKFYRVGKITMENKQTNKKSILSWTGRALGAQLDAAMFESQALED
jgi:hypothetical protein